MYVDGTSHQLFVGTQMGNIYRYSIVHNEALGINRILPNPITIKINEQWNNLLLNSNDSIFQYLHVSSNCQSENRNKLYKKLYQQRLDRLNKKRTLINQKIRAKKKKKFFRFNNNNNNNKQQQQQPLHGNLLSISSYT